MRTETVKLVYGLTIGDTTHTDAVIKESTAGDIIDATEESERLFPTPDGYVLVASDTMVGLNVLRRQIVSIGGYKGPLSMTEIKKLHPIDLNALQKKAGQLETASLKAASRGRDETPGQGDD